jgi:osmotically-inducible protein OsmY
MKSTKPCSLILAALALGALLGCSATSTKSAEVADSIQSSLQQAGFKDVSVSQDREKGIVTLGGRVASEGEKAQAESIAKSLAGQQVVANSIAVLPPGAEKDARQVNSDLDKGIDHNLHAALVVEKLDEHVKYTVKNHVVTLAGNVDTPEKRARAGEIASTVPNVQQVVNELQVKAQKATSTK